ncbi:uncharacterized protein CIMG_12993 [Coccidioides immitis RS]|uniref:Uncharacterized protein n=4 Tax=Coccidioides immitis TaxID=5501 RepID=J3K6W0_COCIM|nr:uncharacterized protein CIMG_12993 [Coccidioides immitis RS]KMP02905.1 hypothetical protein CIRG_02597 [Coccidioides immitis RMSCC 2394]KMU82084.1 hypothetical protein CISG_09614 [Coccidioides immitis RMSCC 3703]KMU91795.1 hypothetical protein CIHG_09668 [Coccidioides immitis H538.4]TPX23345.1 hypothetical protein DIZ76_012674 [Coccidioides immitis]EAS30356.3 hypothetical protein CIMG_12993 [Coccidioides immitis RS]
MSNTSFAVSSQQANVPNPSTVPAGEPQLNHDLSLEPGGLYVVLFRMAKPGQYHWSLVVAANERTGMMYHNTNLGGGPFRFEARWHPHLLNSTHFLTAIKISNLTAFERELHLAFVGVLEQIPIQGKTCRTWLKEAIYVTADQGYTGFQPDRNHVEVLEDEGLFFAGQASNGQRSVVTSQVFNK